MISTFFSVIIPTLNEEHFLPKLLADLSLQTFKRFEVIVIDANSSDKTVSLAREYAKYLKLKIRYPKMRNMIRFYFLILMICLLMVF